MTAYYNENNPKTAAWLRELIKDGLIANGEVDDRSITDVTASDLRGFTQHHFFAGVGVWSYSLRLAGWRDEWPIVSGSCPCQPFSSAGNRKGTSDDRHLWPAFFELIKELDPTVVIGEQVASSEVVGRVGGKRKDGDGSAWFDVVQADLEAARYTVGSVDIPSAGVGAPHIRQRLYWCALGDSIHERLQGRVSRRKDSKRQNLAGHAGRRGAAFIMANPNGSNPSAERKQRCRQLGQLSESGRAIYLAYSESGQHNGHRSEVSNYGEEFADSGADKRMADTASSRREQEYANSQRRGVGDSAQRLTAGLEPGSSNNRLGHTCSKPGERYAGELPSTQTQATSERRADGRHDNRHTDASEDVRPNPTNGFWANPDWIGCTDNKFRPIESSIEPLVTSTSKGMVHSSDPGAQVNETSEARTLRLHGYGNAINAECGRVFVSAVMKAVERRAA